MYATAVCNMKLRRGLIGTQFVEIFQLYILIQYSVTIKKIITLKIFLILKKIVKFIRLVIVIPVHSVIIDNNNVIYILIKIILGIKFVSSLWPSAHPFPDYTRGNGWLVIRYVYNTLYHNVNFLSQIEGKMASHVTYIIHSFVYYVTVNDAV